MILSAILTILTALTPVLAMMLKDYAEQRQADRKAQAPIDYQGKIDAEIIGDKRALSVRLARLHNDLRAGGDRAG